jgi:hypothetical protein
MNGIGMDRQSCRVAALRGGSSADIQSFLGEFATRLTREGWKVAGAIEIAGGASTGACGRFAVRNVSTGEVISISQNLGPGSTACSLDPAGLADACAAVERSIAAGVDLVIISKFAKQEAARGGMSDAFRAAIAAGVPILTSVSPAMSDAWRAFAGPLSRFLPVDPDIVDAWWSEVRMGSSIADHIAAKRTGRLGPQPIV